jgi:polyphenol oxidase
MRMLRKEKDGVTWLEFSLLQEFPHVRHGVFTRHGGVSTGTCNSLNVAFDVGDLAENVQENRARIRKSISLEKNVPEIISANQEHSDTIYQVKAPKNELNEPPRCDVLVTNVPSQALLIKHADCQVAIFYDPKNNVCANVHAGWRGSVRNIYKKTIEMMKQEYGSKPENLIVCISPSLGPQAAEFINYKTELPEEFWDFQVKPTYFDFWGISKWQLLQCGVLPQHIEIAKICTYSTPTDFFSYRREKVSGRHATVVCIIP